MPCAGALRLVPKRCGRMHSGMIEALPCVVCLFVCSSINKYIIGTFNLGPGLFVATVQLSAVTLYCIGVLLNDAVEL